MHETPRSSGSKFESMYHTNSHAHKNIFLPLFSLPLSLPPLPLLRPQMSFIIMFSSSASSTSRRLVSWGPTAYSSRRWNSHSHRRAREQTIRWAKHHAKLLSASGDIRVVNLHVVDDYTGRDVNVRYRGQNFLPNYCDRIPHYVSDHSRWGVGVVHWSWRRWRMVVVRRDLMYPFDSLGKHTRQLYFQVLDVKEVPY